ncbi:MAG: ELWxxDGT repeat protein [Chloroflexota bacterium]
MFSKPVSRFIVSLIFVLLLIGGATTLLRARTADNPPLRPYLVKEINTTSQSSSPHQGISLNGIAYFVADDGISGQEIWWSDGSESGLLKDIYPHENFWPDPEVSPLYLTVSGNQFFFVTDDGEHGHELWRSDGTTEGTQLVKDIRAGAASGWPAHLTAVHDTLYFTTSVPNSSQRLLWRSDGTDVGTYPVLDDPNIREIDELTAINNKLYFAATTVDHGDELWVTDGTSDNTDRVKDINPGFGSSEPTRLTAVHDTLYFMADDGSGKGVWRSDGTEEVTELLFNRLDVDVPLDLNEFAVHEGDVYFTIDSGRALWVTNETAVHFQQLMSGHNFNLTLPQPTAPAFYFTAYTSELGEELWLTDSTPENTQPVADIYPGSQGSYPATFTVWQDALYYAASAPESGRELWRTDATGTHLAVDFLPGSDGSNPSMMLPMPDYLLLGADHVAAGDELWRVDNMHEAQLVTDINTLSNGSFPEALTAVSNNLFFVARDNRFDNALWFSDGTDAGTRRIKGLESEEYRPFTELTAFQNWLYFMVESDIEDEIGFWRSDGSTTGTELVLTSNMEPFWYVWEVTAVHDALYFLATTEDVRQGLWRTDGATATVTLVVDFALSNDFGSPEALTNVNGTLFFMRQDYEQGYTLWRSDGQEPALIKTLQAAPTNGHWAGALTAVYDQLFFVAENEQEEQVLWVSDGTASGTHVVKDIANKRTNFYIHSLVASNDKLYFFAGTPDDTYLWQSDGTEAGTHRVSMLRGNINSYAGPNEATVTSDRFYFSLDDGQFGFELWQSDGTDAGTLMVADINPRGSSLPYSLTAVHDTLFFSADEPENGREYWYTTGVESGASLLQDINPKSEDGAVYYPSLPAAAGRKLYFVADDGNGNHELWAVSTLSHRFYLTLVPQ